MKYQLAEEKYRGESIKYVQNILNDDSKVVIASWPSHKIRKVLGTVGFNKKEAGIKIRKMIDNYKGGK